MEIQGDHDIISSVHVLEGSSALVKAVIELRWDQYNILDDNSGPRKIVAKCTSWAQSGNQSVESATQFFEEDGADMLVTGFHLLLKDLIQAGASLEGLTEAVSLALIESVMKD